MVFCIIGFIMTVYRLVIPDDFFNPFHILKISSGYEAHVVPGMLHAFLAFV